MMLNVDDIRQYWEIRAKKDTSAQSTTQDVYLRSIEQRALLEQLGRRNDKDASILDVGCGDGRTTIGIAMHYQNARIHGIDYSEAMIQNARMNQKEFDLSNVDFETHDIQRPLAEHYDCAYTTRCLINLPTWELQIQAIRNIHIALREGGYYYMIENFVEGQNNFNDLRMKFDLPKIPIRDHNLFFERNRLVGELDGIFAVEGEINISSTYYMVSRVIYSRICMDLHKEPSYFDDHHRYAADLPFSGEHGPVRLLVLRKK